MRKILIAMVFLFIMFCNMGNASGEGAIIVNDDPNLGFEGFNNSGINISEIIQPINVSGSFGESLFKENVAEDQAAYTTLEDFLDIGDTGKPMGNVSPKGAVIGLRHYDRTQN